MNPISVNPLPKSTLFEHRLDAPINASLGDQAQLPSAMSYCRVICRCFYNAMILWSQKNCNGFEQSICKRMFFLAASSEQTSAEDS
jgi:hypothetical protein